MCSVLLSLKGSFPTYSGFKWIEKWPSYTLYPLSTDLISDKKKRLEQEIERLMAPRPRPAADIEIERRSGDESEEDDGSELDEAPSPRQRHRRDTDASHTNGDHVKITVSK